MYMQVVFAVDKVRIIFFAFIDTFVEEDKFGTIAEDYMEKDGLPRLASSHNFLRI